MKINKRRLTPHEAKYPYLMFPSGLKSGNFMTVDPGLGGTGYAIYNISSLHNLVPPYNSGSIAAPAAVRDDSFLAASLHAASAIAEIVKSNDVKRVFMELPQNMNSAIGTIARKKNDIVKLSITFGAISGLCGVPCVPLPIMDWKGTTKKQLTMRRIARRLPGWEPTTKADHEKDAVLMGLFVKGFYSGDDEV